MISQIPINIFRFIVLILFQVLILNHIQLGGYINPMIYIYWVLILPIEIPSYLLLILAFGMGISIDAFTGQIGLNTAATVFMAFLRPTIIRSVTSKRDYEPGVNPRINDLGLNWFLTYVILMTIIHHFILFFLEAMSFHGFWLTLLRILFSSFFTILVIVFTELTFSKSKRKKA
jgi:rod shape-determining protein MreD